MLFLGFYFTLSHLLHVYDFFNEKKLATEVVYVAVDYDLITVT